MVHVLYRRALQLLLELCEAVAIRIGELHIVERRVGTCGQNGRLRKAAHDVGRDVFAVDGIGDSAAKAIVREDFAVDIIANVLHDGAFCVPELVVVVEAGEGGGVRVGEDEVHVFVLKVVSHLGGLFDQRQGNFVEVHDGSGRLPPVGVPDKAGVAFHDVGPRAKRGCFVDRAVLDDRNVEKKRQALVGRVGGERQGRLVVRSDGQNMAQAGAIVDRTARGKKRIGCVLRGDGASVGEAGFGPYMDSRGEAVAGYVVAFGQNRGDLERFAADDEQRLIEEREDAAVIEALAVIRVHAVAFLIGKTKGRDVVEDLGHNGGCLRGGGFLRGGSLLLGLRLVGGFAGKLAREP